MNGNPENLSPVCAHCSNRIPPAAPLGICPACTFSDALEGFGKNWFADESNRPEIVGYEIGGLLGRGGMGDVYLATEKKLDRLVAVKVLRIVSDDFPDEQEMEIKARFLHESKALSSLSHPSIVTILDFGETSGGVPFFVMEYVEGADLQKAMREDPPDTLKILEWGKQLCSALDYAHGKGIVHRDIKPANVLVSREGYVKLVDFGLAKIHPPDQVQGASMTFSQVAVGTPDYVAPEQIMGSDSSDHRTDIYSLGVLLYEMATQRIPRGSWVKASRMNPALGKEFDTLISKSLEPDPEARFQSVHEFQRSLGKVKPRPHPSYLRPLLRFVLPASILACLLFGAISWNEDAALAGEKKQLYEEFHAAPVPDAIPSYRIEHLLDLPITRRDNSFPLKKNRRIGEPVLLRLEGSSVKEMEIPEELDLRFADSLEWVSPSRFVCPSRNGGVAEVSLGKTGATVKTLLRGLDDTVQIEASRSVGIVLRANGAVAAWPPGRLHPFYPPRKPLGRAVKIAAGEKHGAALLTDGSVRVWGGADMADLPTPYPFDNVVDIGAGANFTAVLTENGRVFAWGDNAHGQCDVPGDLPAVSRIVCQDEAIYVLQQNGVLRAWGKDIQIETGAVQPTLYKRLFAPSRDGSVFAERTSGEWEPIPGTIPEVWSQASRNGISLSRFTEVSIQGEFLLGWRVPDDPNTQNVSAKSSKLISIHRSHTFPGGLYTGSIPENVERVTSFSGSFSAPAQSKIGHVLAVNDHNEIVIWGENRFGQKNVPEINGRIEQVTAGDRFCAALTDEGSIFVWGANKSQRPLAPISHSEFVCIDAGENFGVALDSKGIFFGWGNNSEGQLTPPDPAEKFRLIAAEGQTTLGLTTDGELRIWGETKIHDRSTIPETISLRAKETKKIGLSENTCWILLKDNTLLGWGNVGKSSESAKPLWLPYPDSLAHVQDFWVGKCGLIVRLTDNTYRGFHISWPQDELSRLLEGAAEILVTRTHILAGVR